MEGNQWGRIYQRVLRITQTRSSSACLLIARHLVWGEAMHLSRIRVAMALSLALLVASACAEGPGGRPGQSDGQNQATQSLIVSAKDFSRSRFEDSTNVTNRWFPLKPGTQYVYTGHAFDDGERIRRRVVSTVTDLTKVVAGVEVRVVWDRDYDDKELVEAELAFFAQDAAGNVWLLGEYPEEYDDGELEKAPAWIEGIKGARAGLAMKAEPGRPGTASYAQGFAPAPLYWDDRARVYKTGVRTCVPVDCYDNVLVMEEFERRKPGAFQLKYYAPDVGGVRVGWRGPKEEEKETLVLANLVQLKESDMAIVRREALALEKRAYKVSNDVYGRTEPILQDATA
jgi:hypothetical protein